MTTLPAPPSPALGADPAAVPRWVAQHLGDLTSEGPDEVRAGAMTGGQSAADEALQTLDITGYARSRSTVLPESRRGASRLSPYIRHGLLTLPAVWDSVRDAVSNDRRRFRDELMWQEYARHLYARVGTGSQTALRREQPTPTQVWQDEPWPASMRCIEYTTSALRTDGWLVNQTRMWLASQWTVRAGADWRAGEDEFFTHLLDGSRAANRLGWQWTVGTGSGKPYGFSRWQVQKRAPQLCAECALATNCPIESWPDTRTGRSVTGPDLGPGSGDAGAGDGAFGDAGPSDVQGSGGRVVWLTAESLGRDDPALRADATRPAVFVFDEPLLSRLRLSGKRLVFLAETLGELAGTRELSVRRGRVTEELAGLELAATWTPVPGWATRAARLRPVETHPWPWLSRPQGGPVRSFSSWRHALRPAR